MTKQKRNLLVFVLVVLLLAELFWALSVKNDLAELQHSANQNYNNLFSQLSDTQTQLTQTQRELEDMLAAQGSILTASSLELGVQDDRLTVTVHFTPKLWNAGEAASVSILVDGQTYRAEAEPDGGAGYTAAVLVPICQEIIPVVTFESADGVRSEALEAARPDELLVFPCEAQLAPDGMDSGSLYLSLYENAYDNMPFADAAHVYALVCSDEMSTHPAQGELGRVEMTPVSAQDIPSDMKPGSAVYSADLSQLLSLEDARFVTIELVTDGGLSYWCELFVLRDGQTAGYSANSYFLPDWSYTR
jgi:hypothetical protein